MAGTGLFVLGFALVFVSSGALFGGLGSQLVAYARPIQLVVGSLAIVLGLVFAGVLGFNLVVTFGIGEVALGLMGCAWAGAMLAPIVARVRRARALAPAAQVRAPARDGQAPAD